MAAARYTVRRTEKSVSLDAAVAWHVVDNETGHVVQYARLRRDAVAWVRVRTELEDQARRTVQARIEAMYAENRAAERRSIF